MSLHVVSELWFMVRDSLTSYDRETFAEQLVSLLIEESFSPDDIKEMFKNDSDIKLSLQSYIDDENHVMNLEDWDEDGDFDNEDVDDDWS